MSNTYRKKNLPITAIQWDGNNTNEVVEFSGGRGATPTGNILIFSNNFTSFTMKKGDYAVKEGNSVWVMDKEAFESEYEKEGE